MTIRRREERDLDALAALAARVQSSDGYPGRRPRDLRTFLVSEDALGAWVAERDGCMVGHVALHPTSLAVVMECARRALAVAVDDELAVVARLIVSPTARREGIGSRLLEHAATAARVLGRHPILDVVTRYDAANALYLAAGWVSAGEVEMRFADGTTLNSYVYAAPT